MPTAPTGMEPSKLDPELGDEEAPARRSEYNRTPNSPPEGPNGEMAPADLPTPDAGKAPKDESTVPGPLPDPR